jgi:hypothetical protein
MMSDSPFGPYADDAQEDAVKSFIAATEPDEPQIDVPREGSIELQHGLIIDGEQHKTAEVRELNGADEEVLSKFDPNDPSYNVTFTDTVLRRAVLSIGGREPTQAQLRSLLLGDREILFKEIMLATYGDEKEYEDVICQKCQGGNDLKVDFNEIVEVKELEDDPESVEETLRDGRIVLMHYPTGADQIAVFQGKKELTEAEGNTGMLIRCIKYVDGKPPADPPKFAKEMGVLDRKALIKRLAKGPSVRFKEVEVPCVHCGQPMKFRLSWADLLLD